MMKINTLSAAILCAFLTACTIVGQDFTQPDSRAPSTWQAAHNGDLSLPKISHSELPSNFWQAFNDPILNELEQRALQQNLDVQSALLRFAQARVARQSVENSVDLNFSGMANRQRLSENGSSTRTIDLMSGRTNTQASSLKQALASPFNLFQTGFDASWEPDFWGKISRQIEASEAEIRQQAAQLQLARLTLVSEVAQTYFDYQASQTQIALLKQQISLLTERNRLLEAKFRYGVISDINPVQQQSELEALKAQLPLLQAQAASQQGQLATLLGESAGSLNGLLTKIVTSRTKLPSLALGLPSEVARRRPDLLAAEAKLHAATAQIGVAEAALYPSFRIGAKAGLESLSLSDFADWGSKTANFGISFDLPIFDGAKRKSTVQLRELQQQEAAVDYQQTALKAWQEIDQFLNQYSANSRQIQALQQALNQKQTAQNLLQARQRNGLSDELPVLDAKSQVLQAKQQLTLAQLERGKIFVGLNKAIGNVPEQ